MKTYTIRQKEIEPLDSDKSRLEYINQIIALLSDPEKTPSSKIDEALIDGLNYDLPEPMGGAPDFDSSNMSASGFKMYSMVRAGYVPAGGKGLNCSYIEYEYKHLGELSEIEFESLWSSAAYELTQSKGKRDHANFLQYLYEICRLFSLQKLMSSA